MSPTFAFLNNINASSMFVLGLLGLLLFGKDLPLIARKLAKEYFRYKKMINDATSDIQREMESAANHLEEEKRRFESDVNSTVPSLDHVVNSDSTPKQIESSNGSSYGDIPADPPPYSNATPQKPSADPLSLDVPAPSSLSHRATEPAKSPAAQVAALVRAALEMAAGVQDA